MAEKKIIGWKGIDAALNEANCMTPIKTLKCIKDFNFNQRFVLFRKG